MSMQTGQRFTRLVVIGPASPSRAGKPRVECVCDCGKTVIACERDLTKDHGTKSCGCYNRDCTRQRNRENRETKHSRFVDLTEKHQKTGRLKAIKVVGFPKSRHAQWECRCDCGNLCVVLMGAFLSESTQSCGCWKIEQETQHRFGRDNPHYKDGSHCIAVPSPA
jgi:hypothetical protein